MPIDVSLDHAGYIVRDLNAGAAAWERLGFVLSPFSPQMGLNAAGEFEPWASANRCAVFKTGYIELIGIHSPELFNPWEKLLARFEGAHIAAFRVDSADNTYAALGSSQQDFAPPVARRRDAPFFDAGAWGTREMRFRNIFSDADAVSEARYILIEHQTPEVLWQPCLLEHPNGAQRLTHLSVVAPGDSALARRLALLGRRTIPTDGPATNDQGTFACHRGGCFEWLSPRAFAARFEGASPNAASALGSCTIEVSNLAATVALLNERQVTYRTAADRIWVEPAECNGTIIEFMQAKNPLS